MKNLLFMILSLVSISAYSQDCLFKVNDYQGENKVKRSLRKSLERNGCQETNITRHAKLIISRIDYHTQGEGCYLKVVGMVDSVEFGILRKTPSTLIGNVCVVNDAILEDLNFELLRVLDL